MNLLYIYLLATNLTNKNIYQQHRNLSTFRLLLSSDFHLVNVNILSSLINSV
jgi:hypothetical protein